MTSLTKNLGRLITLALCLFGVACSQPVDAGPIQMGAPFCDGAVLQRDKPIPVWGWCNPGGKISVEFKGQKVTGTAGEDGKWMVKLNPLKASFEPAEMTITGSGEPVTLKNLLVGEVWLASGQSNMQWIVGKSACSKLPPIDPKDGVNPIREFEVTSVYAMLHPIEKGTGEWKDGNYNAYSAIAFAFAHKLYGELGVPIGILNCSFSQTKIQAWVPRIGFRDGEDEYTQNLYKEVLQTDPSTPEHAEAWAAFYAGIEESVAAGKAIPKKRPGNMNDNRDSTWLFNGRLSPVVPYAIRGAIWNQGYANMGEGLPYYHNLHSLIRGWRIVWDHPELPVYFHQFYSPSNDKYDGKPSIGSTAEMRLGTAMARDIPHAGMASQIDIQGAIHYGHKAVPGQRLALHALKNQYQKDVVTDGPFYKSYEVKGNQIIIEFDHAEGGLVVADTHYNAIGKKEDSTGFADPKIIPDGDDQVKLFYLADEKRVWYPASMKIDGNKVIVSSPQVKNPKGVSYGTGGIGFQPNLYNQALLPMTPFIVYDNQVVTSETWPEEKLTIHGETIDPNSIGLTYEYRKMPLLSTQFRDNAVLQADQPVTIWGIATHPWNQWGEGNYPEPGEKVIHFSFNGIEKKIPVTDGMTEWQVTVPAMEASTDPKALKVSFTIDGELIHERTAENIVIGDVWYVAAPDMDMTIPEVKPSGQVVRMIEREAKRDSNNGPSRFSIAVSTTPAPNNRFASYWKDAGVKTKDNKGNETASLAGSLGHLLAAKSGRPVGIIFMQSNAGGKQEENNPPIKSWIPPEYLELAPSLMDDHKQLASLRPGNKHYAANAERYIAAWKEYWGDYIPEMIATKAVPDGEAWGKYPTFKGEVTTIASHTYNVMTLSFTPASLKGVIFLSSPIMVKTDEGEKFGEQVSALATGLKARFACEDPAFLYTIPSKSLAPKITKPEKIEGTSTAVEIGDWKSLDGIFDQAVK
jgi:sialate O-acetylesterase